MTSAHPATDHSTDRRGFMRRAGVMLGGASAAALALGTGTAAAEDAPVKPSIDRGSRAMAAGVAYVIADATPPWRLWDTRDLRFDPYGKLGSGGIRNVVTPYTDTFGIGGVVVNVTITDTEGAGYLTVYPKGPRPGTSTINWAGGGQIAANSTQVFLAGGASDWNIDVYCGGGGRTHFVIDEIAYLVPVL